jgi:hypothetical protein
LRHLQASRKVKRMTHALLLAAAVMVRTYDYSHVPAPTLAIARATADRTFAQSGISLQWIDCSIEPVDRRAPGADSMPCMQPLREGVEFMLRLISAPEASPAGGRMMAMASSLLDHSSRSGALATLDPARVQRTAHDAAADYPTLLGRAIAHEVGHLLLGRAEHSPSGLMRAIWSQDEIRGVRPAGWQFSASESAQMRQALATRTTLGN